MRNLVKRVFFGKKKYQSFFRWLFDISIEGMNIGTGGRASHKNGELAVAIHVLSKEKEPVVFDVGAQGGDYIEAILKITPARIKIYAFEPNENDHRELSKRFRKRITLIRSALGDTEGEADLYFPDDIRGLSTLHRPHEGFNKSERVKTETIDNFCERNHIKNITLLKLDVEGNELACLRGALRMLSHIKYIQFEFGAASRDARIYFRDIFNFLSDYKIYRILKNGLYEIKSPEKITELLFTTNYLAERK